MARWRARVALLFAVAGTALWVSSCFTQNVGRDFQFKPDAKNGLVFASVTVSGDRPNLLFVKYRSVDAKEAEEAQQIPVINNLVRLDWNPKMVGIIPDGNPAGRMLAIELPPGRYEFYSWHGAIPGYSIWSQAPFSYQFESVAGRAVYVGNIHLRFDGRRYVMSILDRHERDIALLHQKVPNVTEDRMDTKLMDIVPIVSKP